MVAAALMIDRSRGYNIQSGRMQSTLSPFTVESNTTVIVLHCLTDSIENIYSNFSIIVVTRIITECIEISALLGLDYFGLRRLTVDMIVNFRIHNYVIRFYPKDNGSKSTRLLRLCVQYLQMSTKVTN